MSSTPPDAWHNLMQPFYILSVVIGGLIGFTIIAIAVLACLRRRATRRRFVRAIDAGWAVPVFDVSDDISANLEAKTTVTGPKPIMRESVLNLKPQVHAEDGVWEHAVPLSMALLPTPSTRPHELLLYLLRTPSILTSNLFSRLKAIRYVRAEQSHLPQQHVAPPPSHASQKNSMSSTSIHSKHKDGLVEVVKEPVQVMFVIAMPSPPPPVHVRNSPSTAHEPVVPIANQELCIGALTASLQVPVQYIKGRRDEQVVGIRHLPIEEIDEEELDYMSTIRTRPARSEDPGHEFAGSFVSSRRLYDYGDEGSSYMPHPTASATPSFIGLTVTGGSTHETHNSYLAPPSFNYGAYNRGNEDSSSVENNIHRYSQEPRQSQESSYPPSRVYTPSLQSGDLPPRTHTSSPPPLPSTSLPRSFAAPMVIISDPDEPTTLREEVEVEQEVNKAHAEEPEIDLMAHRASQFTAWTDTTASATDVDGGYEADAGGRRRLSMKPRGTNRRRGGGA